MKQRILPFFLFLLAALPSLAQTQYISYSRDSREDESVIGYGLKIISSHNDLVIHIVNATRTVETNRYNDRPDGLYEYHVLLDDADTHNPKVEVSRRGSVYKEEFTEVLPPHKLIAYRLEEVATPIRLDNQTRGNDLITDEHKAELEFTTTLDKLVVECPPQLKADIQKKTSPVDPGVKIVSVVFPVQTLRDARAEVERLKGEHDSLFQQIKAKKVADQEAAFRQLESLEEQMQRAEALRDCLMTVEIYSDGTNRLAIDISDMGPRAKKCYAVVPLVIEKEVFVSECNAFMNEAKRLFDDRKYEDARNAYANALNAKDTPKNMVSTIRGYMAECDTCRKYTALSNAAIVRVAKMKQEGKATIKEIAEYVSAAIEGFQIVDQHNPQEFYEQRMATLRTILDKLPMPIRFRIVEWDRATLSEGKSVPRVEIWAYTGNDVLSDKVFTSDRRFRKLQEKQGYNYRLLGTTDMQGRFEYEFDSKQLPRGIVFRPDPEGKSQIHYTPMAKLLQNAKGNYMMRQIRVRLSTK